MLRTSFIFAKKIDDFVNHNIDSWGNFCKILLNQIVILPIECNNQENAMRIFTTLNDRGLSLSDSDIIKGRIYANIQNKEEKKAFAQKWKELETNLIDEQTGEKYFDMNFLFVQYTHITRARNKDSSKEIGLRRFYTMGKYKDVLKDSKVMDEIEDLQELWLDIYDNDRISHKSLQMINVLSLYPNEYWKALLSAYYFYCKDKGLDFYSDKNLLPFLKKSIANLFVKYINIAAVNAIKHPVFNAYINLYENGILDFQTNSRDIINSKEEFKISFFRAQKLIPALMKLYLYSEYPQQKIINGEVEHIFPQKWQNTNYNGWNKEDAKKYLEQIGNKIWLEKKLNIQAGNGYFGKKKEEYRKSDFLEAQGLAEYPKDDWTKEDIEQKNEKIYEKLKEFFETNL